MRSHVIVLLGLVPIACTFDGLDGYTSGDASTGDASDSAVVIDAAPDVVDAKVDVFDAPVGPCDLSKPFGTPVAVTELDTNMIDSSGALSPDELTVFFFSNRLNQGLNVFTASRPNKTTPFGSIAPLASLNFSGADTWNATLTGDGLTAYLVTDQNAADHMYKATRASSLVAFNTPTLMPSPLVKGEQPYILPDGSALYYSDNSGTKGQIARATGLGGTPTVTMQTSLAVAPHDIGIPVVDPTETTIYFTVYDSGAFMSYDIWTASRATATDPWSTPTKVTELDTTAFDSASWISADKCEIFFTRASDPSNWDMYVARRP